MPMMVRQRSAPVMRWPIASHHPHTMSQMTLPIPDAMPASGRLTIVLPNGQSANIAIRSDAMPNGMVMMSTKQIRAAIA
jgi:hypothetical protein